MSDSSDSACCDKGDPGASATSLESDMPTESPVPCSIPQWFLQYNVKTPDELNDMHISLSLVESFEHKGDSEPVAEQGAGTYYHVARDIFLQLRDTVVASFVPDSEGKLSSAEPCVLLKFPSKNNLELWDTVLQLLAQDICATLVAMDLEDFQDIAEAIHFNDRNLPAYQPDRSSSKLDGDVEFRLFNRYFTTYEESETGATSANAMMDLLNHVFDRIGQREPHSGPEKGDPMQKKASPVVLHIRDAGAIMNLDEHRRFFTRLRDTVQQKRKDGWCLVLVISIEDGKTNDSCSSTCSLPSHPSHPCTNSRLAEIIGAKAYNNVTFTANCTKGQENTISTSLGITNARRLRRMLRQGRARMLGEQILHPHFDWTEVGLRPKLFSRSRWSFDDIRRAETQIIGCHWGRSKFDFGLVAGVLVRLGLQHDEKHEDGNGKGMAEDKTPEEEAEPSSNKRKRLEDTVSKEEAEASSNERKRLEDTVSKEEAKASVNKMHRVEDTTSQQSPLSVLQKELATTETLQRPVNTILRDIIAIEATGRPQVRRELSGESVQIGRPAAGLVPEDHPNGATMALSYKPDMSLLKVDPEIALTLSDLSDEELQSFASLQNDPSSSDQVELYIYCNLLVYERDGFSKHIREILLRAEGWVAETTPEHADRSRRLQILDMVASIKMTWDDKLHNWSDRLMNSQLDQTDGEDLPNLMHWLSEELVQTESVDDLDRAIELAKKADNMICQDHPIREGRVAHFIRLLHRRLQHTESTDEKQYYLDMLDMLVDSMLKYFPGRAVLWKDLRILSNLTRSSIDHPFDKPGQTRSLYDVDLVTETVNKFCDNHIQDPENGIDWAIEDLTTNYRRFEETGHVHYLNLMIDTTNSAINSMTEDHSKYTALLLLHAMILERRFAWAGSTDDINRAIELIDIALGISSQDDPSRGVYLYTLGTCHGRRYERTGMTDDLNCAIELIKTAIDIMPKSSNVTPNDNYYRVTFLGMFGRWLAVRFEQTEDMDDLNRAIEAINLAIDAAPQDFSDRRLFLSNLGNCYGNRFENTGSIDDLNHAIEVSKIAVDLSPRSCLDREPWLALGSLLFRRFKHIGSIDDETLCLSTYIDGYDCENASPSKRISLARKAAEILISRANWEVSNQLLKGAVELLPRVSPRSLQHTDKQSMLEEFAGLASDAAAVALNAGEQPYHALQLLESGRSVISSLIMEMRGDISDLKQQHPELAERFTSIRDLLDSSATSTLSLGLTAITSGQRIGEHHFTVDQKLSELIQVIREQPGFRQFLLPPTEEELKATGDHGPIVVINLTSFRSDVFLIERSSIKVLGLPSLTWEEAYKQARALRQSGISYMPQLLIWLWDSICGPILKELGFSNSITDDSWPHIWWIPTGILAQFPFHAAGDYKRGSVNTVLDRVISSYASSVKAIVYGRRQVIRQLSGPPGGNMLLVAMPETPGLPGNGRLEFVDDEVNMLGELCPSLGLKLITPTPRKHEVVRYLQASKIFHFAGHGRSDPVEPSQSSLLLEDWKTDPFTVGDLRNHRFQDDPPFLAYLSACSTGANKTSRLLDEGIHLVGSFQLVGFRHVVGTLWEVSDRHCVDVARILYKTVQKEGMTDLAVARGLHQAIRALRDGRIKPQLNRDATFLGSETKAAGPEGYDWVPYVHFGV